MNSKDPVPGSQTVSYNVAGDGSEATVTVNETSGETGIDIQKIYRLQDNVKYFETRMIITNNKGSDWLAGSVGAGAISLIYLVPGGSSGTNDPADRLFAKTVDGATTTGGLFVGRASTWFGQGGTPLAPALAEGWHGIVDPAKDVAIATTWDLQQQANHAGSTTVGSRFGFFGNRATFEVFYRLLPAAQPLDYKLSLIFDDELKSISYAKEGQVLAGIELDKLFDDAYAPGSVMTATFKLNSLNPTEDVTYSIQNIRIEAKDPVGSSPSFTIAPINNVSVPANAHVVAGTRAITLTDPSLEVGKSYQLKADLYQNGTQISTIESRPFNVEGVNTKVFLYEDATTGSWVLENEVYQVFIAPAQARVTHFILKKANDRNQTLTSIPPHPLFRDFIQPDTASDGSGSQFSGYGVPIIVTNEPTRKALEFTVNAPGGQGGQLVKTFALDSMSSALEVGFKFVNGPTALVNGGVFSEVEMAPGGTGGVNDTLFAHITEGLFSHHPPLDEQTAFTRKFFGEKWDPATPGIGMAGDFPELDQGWMGVVDIGTVSDATVLAWDLPTQKTFSLPMGSGGPKVTMNSFGIGANYGPITVEARFANIPANATLDTKYYLIGDTGYKAVSYVEVGRVMAGIWPSTASATAGAFDVGMTITNIGTFTRTFDIKNIRVTDGVTELVAGPDQTEITLQPATRDTRTLNLNLSGFAEGSYRVLVDLYEGWTKVATLESPTFMLSALHPQLDTWIFCGPEEGSVVCEVANSFCVYGIDDVTPVDYLEYSWRLDNGLWSDFSTSILITLDQLTHGPHTFEVVARDSTGNMDPTPAVRHFTVDTNPPTLQVGTLSVKPLATSAVIEWGTNKSATSQVEYGLTQFYGMATQLDSTLLTGHTVTLTSLIPGTTYHFRLRSVDSCGKEATYGDFTFTTPGDTSPPETQISAGPSDGVTSCSVPVAFKYEGTDDITTVTGLHYSWRMDSGEWSAFSAAVTVSFSSLADGPHVFQVRARDQSGNIDPTPAVRHFTLDTTPPILTDINAAPLVVLAVVLWTTNIGATSQVEYGPTATYGSLTPLDASPVTEHTVRINGLSPDTVYHYRVRSKDNCGNEAVSQDLTFATPKDNTAPETRIEVGPAEGETVCVQPVAFTVSGSDDTAPAGSLTYSWRMDDGSWSASDGATTIILPQMADGPHAFEVRARDVAGNVDATPAARAFSVDLTAPVVSDFQTAPVAGSCAVSWQTDHPATTFVEYGTTATYGSSTLVDTELVTSHSVTITGLATGATYHFRVHSTDACGRETVSADATFTTTPDTSAPHTAFTSGPTQDGKACQSNLQICWAASDDVTSADLLSYSSQLDGAAWANWATTKCQTFTGLATGLHTLTVRAKDAAGNVESQPAVLRFFVDLTPPTLTNIVVKPRDYRSIVSWNTSEPATGQIEYGLTTAYGSTTPITMELAGAHTVTISGLARLSTYHFRIRFGDGCRETISPDQTFTTTDILLPNLAVQQVQAADEAKPGDTIPVTWQTQNLGLGDANGTWKDRVYLSTDDAWSEDDTPLGELASIGPLGEMEVYSGTLDVQVPFIPAGTYHLLVRTDAEGTLAETDESDNTAARPMVLLKVSSLLATPDQVPIDIVPGVPATGKLSLMNLRPSAMSDISATVDGLTLNVNVDLNIPPSLAGMQVGEVPFTVTATDESVLSADPVILFTTLDGEKAEVTLHLTIVPRRPQLVIETTRLESGMVRGRQTIVECQVRNTGSVAATGLQMLLPPVAWMSAATGPDLGDLAPGEATRVALLLQPEADHPLGIYNGSIALSGDNAAISIPYSLRCNSDARGGLKVVAADEFTYFAETHPYVAGAHVALLDPFTGDVVVGGDTDTAGKFVQVGVAEGTYNIRVTAEKHGVYLSSILIRAGQETVVLAFLPRQLVTYQWTVFPIDTPDRYAIELQAVFETNVPAPVVTISPTFLDASKLNYDENGQAVVNYTITNHGLIAANNVTFSFPERSDYQMVPTTESLGTISALTSVVVPVTVTKPLGVPVMAAAESSGTCTFDGAATYQYDCGGVRDCTARTTVKTDCAVIAAGPIFDPRKRPGYIDGDYLPPLVGPYVGPYITPAKIAQQQYCQACREAKFKVFYTCLGTELLGFLVDKCWMDVILAEYDTISACFEPNHDPTACLVHTLGNLFDVAGGECFLKSIPLLGSILSAWLCGYDISHACDNIPKPSAQIRILGRSAQQTPLTDTEAALVEQAQRLSDIVEPYIALFGEKVWLDQQPDEGQIFIDWLTLFQGYTDFSSEGSTRISDSERSLLVALRRPQALSVAEVHKMLDRWNRTLDYYDAGIINIADVPAGHNSDFIAQDVLRNRVETAQASITRSLVEGYTGIGEGFLHAREAAFSEYMQPEAEGVCASVRIQLDQNVTLTRSAFQATLEVMNAPQNVSLENLKVDLDIRDRNEYSALSVFSIGNPTVNGTSDVSGTGSVAPGTTAKAQWTIIPTLEAAPMEETTYYVSGTLSYLQDGTLITIPLFPTTILVKPDPQLQMHYFLQRDVYSDDPFTPEVEPIEPFSLGLLVKNSGFGTARAMQITTSQPRIVDNEMGLSVQFQIKGTQVNDQPITPSLTVGLGDVLPGEAAVARWLMTSTLQGRLTEFDASFRHVDDLGWSRSSLIESVVTHDLEHVVRVVQPTDDNRPDFLADDAPDAAKLPDVVWNSDGTTAPVTAVTNPDVLTQAVGDRLEVALFVEPTPSGFLYIRAEDPGRGNYRLTKVVRSDGREIWLDDNAWTTNRTIRLQGQPPRKEYRFHLFDSGSTRAYTLYYQMAIVAPDPVISALEPSWTRAGSPGFNLTVTGLNLVNRSAVRWNGEPLPTTWTSPTRLTATVASSRLANPGLASITVANPAGSGGISNTKPFTVLPTEVGEVNSDGFIDMLDVASLLRIAGGLATADRIAAGDIAPWPSADPRGYGDGKIDVLDAAQLLRLIGVLGVERRLVFIAQPDAGAAKEPLSPRPVVAVRDRTGATVTTFNGAVTLFIQPGTGAPGAVLTGTTTVYAVNGVATFTDVAIDRPGNGYVLMATASPMAPAYSAPFDIGAAERVSIVRVSVPIGLDGVLTPDEWGDAPAIPLGLPAQNVLAGSWSGPDDYSATLQLKWDENALYVAVRALDDVVVHSGWWETFDADGLDLYLGMREPQDPARISFDTPGDYQLAFLFWQDAFLFRGPYSFNEFALSMINFPGSVITDTGYTIEGRIPWQTYTGTIPHQGQVIGFNAVGLDSDSVPAILESAFSLGGLPGYQTNPSRWTSAVLAPAPPGLPAAALSFYRQPSGAEAGVAFTPKPIVVARDEHGQIARGYSGPVTLGIQPGTGAPGAILTGTITVNAVNGVATFADVAVDRPGVAYVLTATSASLSPATSEPFDVKLSGQVRIPRTTVPITLDAILTPEEWADSPVIPLGLPAQNVQPGAWGGPADYSASLQLKWDEGGLYVALEVTDDAIVYLPTFWWDEGYDADGLELYLGMHDPQDPKRSVFDSPGDFRLAILHWGQQDWTVIFRGPYHDFNDFATALASAPGYRRTETGYIIEARVRWDTYTGAIPQAGKTIGFNAVGIDTDQTPSTLESAFSMSGLPGYQTNPSRWVSAMLVPSATTLVPTSISFASQPGYSQSGAPFGRQPYLRVLDQYGNTAFGYSEPVTLEITPGTGTPGASLTGSVSMTTSQGVASFSGIGIDRAGEDYVLTATSGNLPTARSEPFNVRLLRQVDIPKATLPVIADGLISDAEWSGAASVLLGATEQDVIPGLWTGSSDYSGVLHLKWDQTALYFALQVTDDHLSFQAIPDSTWLWARDGLELFIGSKSPEEVRRTSYNTPGDYQVIISADQDGTGSLKSRWYSPQSPVEIDGYPTTTAIVRTATGYNIEGAVPWSLLPGIPVTPSAYDRIGFNVLGKDNDKDYAYEDSAFSLSGLRLSNFNPSRWTTALFCFR